MLEGNAKHETGQVRETFETSICRRCANVEEYGVSNLAEREGFEPSMELLTPYSLSRGAPSATRPPLQLAKYYQVYKHKKSPLMKGLLK